MASAFGHAALAGALGASLPEIIRKPSVIILGILCSIIPDADVLSFKFGIPYGALWGHRGMTHSIIFGLLFGILLMILFHRKAILKDKYILAAYYSICTISHGLLDGLTTGGKGVAYFSPWDTERYFLPFRVIKVSPLGVSNFFSKWGLAVIKSEFLWIGIPSLIFILIVFLVRKITKSSVPHVS